MIIFKIVALILTILTGFKVDYNRVDGAHTGYYTVYDLEGNCMADDYELLWVIEDFVK